METSKLHEPTYELLPMTDRQPPYSLKVAEEKLTVADLSNLGSLEMPSFSRAANLEAMADQMVEPHDSRAC